MRRPYNRDVCYQQLYHISWINKNMSVNQLALDKSDKSLDKKQKAVVQHVRKILGQKNIQQYHIQQCLNMLLTQKKKDIDFKKQASEISSKYISAHSKLLSSIETRQKLIRQALDLFDTISEVPDSLLEKIRVQSQNLLEPIREWTQWIHQYTPNQQFILEKSFRQNKSDENYFKVFFYENEAPTKMFNFKIKQKDEVVIDDPNPTFLIAKSLSTSTQTTDKIKNLIGSIFGNQARQQYENALEKIFDSKLSLKRQKSLDRIQEYERMKELLHSDSVSYENLGVLKKYRSLGGSPKKYRKAAAEQILSRKLNEKKGGNQIQNGTLQKYYSRLEKLKQSVSSNYKKGPKTRSKSNTIFQQKLVQSPEKTKNQRFKSALLKLKQTKEPEKFMNLKIRMIAQKEHDKEQIGNKKTDIEKAYFLTTKITRTQDIQTGYLKKDIPEYKIEKQEKQEKQSQREEKISEKKALEAHQKQKEANIIEINKSLNNLKSKIQNKQPISSVLRLSRNSHFQTSNNAQKIQKSNYLTASPGKSKFYEKQSNSSHYSTAFKEVKKERDILENKDKKQEENIPIEPITKQKIDEEASPKKKKLVSQQEHLEQILEDIENENAEKQNQLNKKKNLSQQAKIRQIQKQQKIKELQKKIREYGEQPETNRQMNLKSEQQPINGDTMSEKESNKQLSILKNQKKQRKAEISAQKDQFVKEMKKASQKLLVEEQRFTVLKEEEMAQEEKIIKKQLERESQSRIQELEKKTVQLKKMIEKEEKRRKQNEQQLKKQLAKNDQVQRQIEKQDQLQELLLAQLDKVSKAKQERKAQKERKEKMEIEKLKKEIIELEEEEKATLMEHQRDSQAMHSMFEAIRVKNIELQASIRRKKQTLSELREFEAFSIEESNN